MFFLLLARNHEYVVIVYIHGAILACTAIHSSDFLTLPSPDAGANASRHEPRTRLRTSRRAIANKSFFSIIL